MEYLCKTNSCFAISVPILNFFLLFAKQLCLFHVEHFLVISISSNQTLKSYLSNAEYVIIYIFLMQTSKLCINPLPVGYIKITWPIKKIVNGPQNYHRKFLEVSKHIGENSQIISHWLYFLKCKQLQF